MGAKVELTFDPGDLGHIYVLDPKNGQYVWVPALDQTYARGLSLWQHKVIRRYAQRQLSARTDIAALAQAKAEIRALVERDFKCKSTHGRKPHAQFLQDHASQTFPTITPRPLCNGGLNDSQLQPMPAKVIPMKMGTSADFRDDEILPVFEASLDLPGIPIREGQPLRCEKSND